MSLIQSIILALIEGITEFLPVSSTGHMILASTVMHIQDDPFVKTFEICIQLGAILAIVMLYAGRVIRTMSINVKLLVAFLPTAVVGLLAYKTIKLYLFNPTVVSASLVIGGIVLVLIDHSVSKRVSNVKAIEEVTLKSAFFIGLIQCISMIPGVSRAAATIIGGVYNGFDKKQATEFSFLLAVPTMFAATGYDLLKTSGSLTTDQMILLGVGMGVAFVSAWIAVKVFLKLVEQYGFKQFGYYRIVLGLLFFVMMRSF